MKENVIIKPLFIIIFKNVDFMLKFNFKIFIFLFFHYINDIQLNFNFQFNIFLLQIKEKTQKISF